MLDRTCSRVGVALTVFVLSCGCRASSGEGTTGSPDRVQVADGGNQVALLDGSDVTVPAAFCDESSSGVRFAAAKETNRAYSEFYGAWGFRFDWFVVIDAECNFWVRGDTGSMEVRAGRLDSATEASIAHDIRLEEWANFMSVPGISDEGVVRLSNGVNQVTCAFNGCSTAAVDDLVSAAADLPSRLTKLSEGPADVGVLSVRGLPDSDGELVTIPEELAELVEEGAANGVENGGYRLIEVSDPELLSWLREQRESFMTSFANPNFDLQVAVEGSRYGIAFRDKTPYEDTLGRIMVFQ